MKKWLRGVNTINIQGRIMVLVFCPSPHSHLSINQVSLKSLYVLSNFQNMARTGIDYEI